MNVPAEIIKSILETPTNYWVNINLQLWSITKEISLPAPFKDNLEASSSVSIVSRSCHQLSLLFHDYPDTPSGDEVAAG
jgi:hypothetical protein